MGIPLIQDGSYPWALSVERLLNYWLPGQGDGIVDFADARARLNAAASDLGLELIGGGDPTSVKRAKTNSIIEALGIPSDASLYLDFTTGRYFEAVPSFSRVSEASFDPDGGPLEMYAQNVLRRDSRGALIERAGTNLIVGSDTFESGWTAQRATVEDGVTIDGAIASKVTETETSSDHRIFTGNFAFGTGAHTFSIDVKSNGRNINISVWNTSSGGVEFFATFDLDAGTVTNPLSNATIRPLGNGWYRCTVTGVAANLSRSIRIRMLQGLSDSYTGDGVSGIYVRRAQLESGSVDTSYISTGTSSVTRAADLLTVPVRDGGRAFVVDLDWGGATGGSSSEAIAYWTDGTADNRYSLYISGNGYLSSLVNSGGGQTTVDTNPLPLGSLSGRLIVYGVLSPEFRQRGVVGISESLISTTPREPLGIHTLGLGNNTYNSANDMNTRARRFMEILNPADPEAAFAQVRQIAQEWAA